MEYNGKQDVTWSQNHWSYPINLQLTYSLCSWMMSKLDVKRKENIASSIFILGMSRTPPVRFAPEPANRAKVCVNFRTLLKSKGLERLKSKVLILKANIQVIVLKSIWGPGSCPRTHVSMQKKF